MANNYKSIPFVDRQKNKKHAVHVKLDNPTFDVTETYTEFDKDLNRVVQKFRDVPYDPREKNKHFKVSDFCLESMIASGSIATATNTHLTSDSFDAISHVETQLENLSNQTFKTE